MYYRRPCKSNKTSKHSSSSPEPLNEAVTSNGGQQTKMASKLRPIAADPERYSRAFKVFTAAYDRAKVYGVWLREVCPEAVWGTLVQKPGRGCDELRMLGVGSGNGQTECDMLHQLLRLFPRIYNRVVEPNGDFVQRYGELVASKAHELRGVCFDWQQLTIEAYEKARDLRKFHLISAFHCLYHVEDLRHSLMFMYDLLEPDGVLLIMDVSDEDQCYRLRKHVKSSGLCPRLVSSADIRAILEREGVPYSTVRQRYETDVSECFNEGSEEGSLMLDLLLMVANFRQTASADLKARVMAFLAANTRSDSRDNGKIILQGSQELLIIKKL